MLIAEIAFPLPLHKTFHYLVDQSVHKGIAEGSRVVAPFGPRRRLQGFVVDLTTSLRSAKPSFKLKKIERLVDPEPLLSAEQVDLARWMARRFHNPLGECLAAVLPGYVKKIGDISGTSVLRRRNSRHTSEDRHQFSKEPFHEKNREIGVGPQFSLTSGQEKALGVLTESLRRGSQVRKTFLLLGVPASGKTEIYMRLVQEAVSSGGQALFLVPEISLTEPFLEEFRSRVGVPVVSWHSRAGVSSKRRDWLDLLRGAPAVIVGARSACLLPFKNLRIAVIDEEQDDSYKQEGTSPCYHAREVVIHRARAHGTLVIMGSATPSLESYAKAVEGKWDVLRLDERVGRKCFPAVHIVDQKTCPRDIFSPQLSEKIRQRLSSGEQVILLLNRRGFSTSLVCRKCGWLALCPSCKISLVLHSKSRDKKNEDISGTSTSEDRHHLSYSWELRCHHCGHRAKAPMECPNCRNPVLDFRGIGTQKIERLLASSFPEARVVRLDRDIAKGADRSGAQIYRKFKERQADILVGTRLVAKGFHFPDVTLVGIVDSDTVLGFPDFRSAEKTFQLL